MDASYDLRLAVVKALRADATVTSFVGSRIFDRVPQKEDGTPAVISPYISFGPDTIIPDDYECIPGEEITFQLDAWSWGGGEAFGSVEVRKIAGAVKKVLHDAELSLTTNALATLSHELTRIMRDTDGITNHAAIQFTAIVEIR